MRAIHEYGFFKDYNPPGQFGFNPNRGRGEDYQHPAIIDTRVGEQDYRMLVRPGRDMFCLKMQHWTCPVGLPFDADIHMSFLSHTSFKRDLAAFQRLKLRNIAIEFDQSWFRAFPDSIHNLKNEESERGYLGYWLAWINGPQRLPKLWIIDKEAKWAGPFFNHDIVYRDFDAEYIQVDWSDVVNYEGYGAPRTASLFMKKMELWWRDVGYRPVNGDGFKPRDIFRLLVRRDNEVENPGLSNWHDGFGWVIDKDDDWDERLGMIDYSDGDEDSDENLDSDASSHED
ncbi:uncharacterized protein FIESC28_05949 [Fusarium coffeatum]|uniref:Uncharacterized protein n=1 Tax=Fusarium coffeatum TaxID=231269 RepID=A0A366RPF9_9HYPO|nr:uncharacterized protein FIESC28_05949 [Fusarium coffeatum]RBR18672.1 hypothetical protein FIESC28_05949 [Fusarium coffeatum]